MSDYERVQADETAMVPGFFRGYRVWIMRPVQLSGATFTLRLHSYTLGTPWETGENLATHKGFTHTAPMSGCSCGLYAKHTIPQLVAEFGHALGAMKTVVGSIKAYGKVLLGDKGFRAEKAIVESLYVPFANPFVDYLSNIYGARVYHSLDRLTRDFPPISVDHLLTDGPKLVPLWFFDEEPKQLKHPRRLPKFIQE